ncbi:nuclear transport factor 2 family protein [Streptomyces racemochromogenes]|uniref:Nuclear transport factor 2 family protein n=1 Tax=Streptomyces racemochromogenes TaxID=67353 RepID=A0ABW7P702_9ACTN
MRQKPPMDVMGEFLTALTTGALAEALGLVHPEATFRIAPGLPYAADYRGPEGLAAMYGAIFEYYDVQIRDTDMWPLDSERVLLHARVVFTSRSSGKALLTTTVEIYTVRDGLVRDLDAYHKDPAAVAGL